MKVRSGIILIVILSLFQGCGYSTPKQEEGIVSGEAVLTFENIEHHLGVLKAGEKAGCFFKYTNTGTGPLVITAAATSCGCTVPRYDKKPLEPGDSGSLEVIFDSSGREGFQTKTITIMSNASVPVIVLKLTAEVSN